MTCTGLRAGQERAFTTRWRPADENGTHHVARLRGQRDLRVAAHVGQVGAEGHTKSVAPP